MSKLKKVLLAVSIMVFTFSLVGCSKESKDDDTKASSTTKQTSLEDSEETTAKESKETASTQTNEGLSVEDIKAKGKIRIGVFSDKAPFGYMDEDGELQGYDIYFAKRLAKELLGDEDAIEWVILEPANRVEYLESDKVDLILANFTKTAEREEKVDFALPYMKVSLGVVSADTSLISDVSELEGKKLIVIKGTTAETYFTENYPDIEQVKYDQISEAFQALADGRGDALTQDNTLLLAWAQENEGYTVGIPTLGDIDVIAPAVKKGNTDLLEWVNQLIKDLAKEEFFHANYEATLLPVYGDTVDSKDIVIEGGVIK